MQVSVSGPPRLSGGHGRRTPLPLRRLVEDGRSAESIPNHLLDSKIYAKVKSNSLIEAEPSELHFSGCEVGSDYLKSLKLINVSSEVMNIHIIPTQTRHFQTAYTKKHRLVPGLAYTVKVQFCPDEWRYFYDCVRVHCEGEENLLIPVHAYPVIDDLHVPPRVDLAAVPLGRSVSHVIPLRCSCPIDFEFQVYVIQSHEAFSVHPLAGVIPADGQVDVTVTFSPLQYETCQVTIQLVVSQFNTKPYLCTITGSSAPHLHLSQMERQPIVLSEESRPPPPAVKGPPRSKTKASSTKEALKSKTARDQTGPKPGETPQVDVCTPAGVAKMLMRDRNKLTSKALREVMSSSDTVGPKNRQMKEALFIKKIQQNVKEEQQANHLRRKTHLGKDPVSEHTRRQIMAERESALHEYMVKRGDARQEDVFASGPPKLSSRRLIIDAGQGPGGAPSFQFYSSFQWELKQRALRLFQQAARKVVIRCRMNRRLASLKELSGRMTSVPASQKAFVGEEKTCDLKVSPERVFPSYIPIFSDDPEPLAPGYLAAAPVDPIDATVMAHVPFFKLQVPQHYKLMGYKPVSAWEAFSSYIPPTLPRPLRNGAPIIGAKSNKPVGSTEDVEAKQAGEDRSFTLPEALLSPVPAHPLRIFNPAPGLQPYKPSPKYLESDLEFHLCPLPRYTTSETCGIKTQAQHTQTLIKGVMAWKDFDSIAWNCLSNQPALTADSAPRRSVDYNTDMLPLTAPPPLTEPPGDLTALTDKRCEDSGIQLTPEMIRAEFLSGEALFSSGNLSNGVTGE